MKPTGKEPPLPGLLGRPHSLFDNSFVIEFLQPPPELDASVLFRATYKGGHEATKLGKQHPQRSQPKGRSSNTVFLLWGHPRHTTVHSAGAKFPTSFPPDMDAAFFLALLGLVDAVHGQRLTMSPGLGATLMMMQTASESCLILLPKAWWLGSLRWRIPWTAQVMLESIRSIFDRRSPVQIVDDVIESQFVRRQ
ncbi:hypothetical protein TrVFT333_006420 [Trichoderma virens FT-333]|nr:hypothetical protein TrVFT333_006420 [Trichoderma virens FT-333]